MYAFLKEKTEEIFFLSFYYIKKTIRTFHLGF